MHIIFEEHQYKAADVLDAVEGFLRLNVVGVKNPLCRGRELDDGVNYVFCIDFRHGHANLHI